MCSLLLSVVDTGSSRGQSQEMCYTHTADTGYLCLMGSTPAQGFLTQESFPFLPVHVVAYPAKVNTLSSWSPCVTCPWNHSPSLLSCVLSHPDLLLFLLGHDTRDWAFIIHPSPKRPTCSGSHTPTPGHSCSLPHHVALCRHHLSSDHTATNVLASLGLFLMRLLLLGPAATPSIPTLCVPHSGSDTVAL